jgi:MGT family glycosyltransferase
VARFLFVVPPLAGHVNPTVAVGHELEARGHEVAWAGHGRIVAPLLPATARLLALDAAGGGHDDADELAHAIKRRVAGLRGAAALKFLLEDFLLPLADAMVPGVDAAVRAFQPDVLIADQQAFAGALVARRRHLRWATSATTSAELTRPYDGIPNVGEWVTRRLADLQRRHGIPDRAAQAGDLRFSDQLVIVFTSAALIGPTGAFPGHYVFVGPALGPRPRPAAFPWEWLDPSRRHVLVSLGTVNRDAGRRFFAVAREALAPLADRVQAILVAGPDTVACGTGAAPGAVEQAPAHLLVREHVPQLELLPSLDAVVCHAGHNTVCEALAHGVPLVVAPIRDDQPIVAQQVVDAGAGIRVKFARVGAGELRAAISALLDDPAYRDAARRVRASFAAAGGAAAAADHLEKLALEGRA